MTPVGGFWEGERHRLDAAPEKSGYVDLEPVKWASLLRLRDDVIAFASRAGQPIASTLELGCGAATLSIQFAVAGLSATAVDREPAALSLASRCAADAGVELELLERDFLTAGGAPTTDLVFSGGVLEHYAGDALQEAYARHREASRRWLLIGVPNYDSEVFRSFLEWARRAGRLYDDEHLDIDVPALAAAHGDHVLWDDGCHVVLASASYIDSTCPDLDAYYRALRPFLLTAGGPPAFPSHDFIGTDVPMLVRLERDVGRELRVAHGFMNWWFIERGDHP